MTIDRTKPRRRRKRGKRVMNTLAEPLPVVEGTEWGPCMKALASDRHRAFVLALYEVPLGYGAQVKAAKRAGFGTSTSSAKSWSVIASRLAHDEKIQLAIREEGEKRIRASAPRALRALGRLIESPNHKDHGRAIGMVMDRVHPAEQRHVVDVHHHTDHDAEAVAQLRMFKGLGVARGKLEEMFGYSGLSRYERLLDLEDAKNRPPMIEGRATEISGDAA
jgi:phage terminase small subunit